MTERSGRSVPTQRDSPGSARSRGSRSERANSRHIGASARITMTNENRTAIADQGLDTSFNSPAHPMSFVPVRTDESLTHQAVEHGSFNSLRANQTLSNNATNIMPTVLNYAVGRVADAERQAADARFTAAVLSETAQHDVTSGQARVRQARVETSAVIVQAQQAVSAVAFDAQAAIT